jgi:hypothetical protein
MILSYWSAKSPYMYTEIVNKDKSNKDEVISLDHNFAILNVIILITSGNNKRPITVTNTRIYHWVVFSDPAKN